MMVVPANKMARHSKGGGGIAATTTASSGLSRFWLDKSAPSSHTLQILSFETAKIMSRLVAVYRSLSDEEFSKLRNGAMVSRGVKYLNSTDEHFLLNLAFAEKLEELSTAAAMISRLGRKCCDPWLKNFDMIFANLKRGIVEIKAPELNSKNADKLIQKIQKYIVATSKLHQELESLAEMEAAEKKLNLWKLKVDPKIPLKTSHAYFEAKLADQRKQIKHYKEASIWNLTFDKTVTLMAQVIYIIFTRISDMCNRFASEPHHATKHNTHNNGGRQGRVHPESDNGMLLDRNAYISKSGPIPKISKISGTNFITRFYSQELAPKKKVNLLKMTIKSQRLIQSPPPSTVGGSCLALRYANIITLAEKYLHSPLSINNEARGFMYDMLPMRIRSTVEKKLSSRWHKKEDAGGGHALAEGWRDAVEEILGWLGPMAQDTMTWHAERSLEKQRFDAKPTVLLFQTLYFSDMEKTEAAIVEVLVGLSCVFRYENQRSPLGNGGGMTT